MVEFTKNIKVGPSDEAGVLLGPIQNSMQFEKVKGFFEDSKKKGYKFAVGQPDVAPSKGFFVQPTIIDNPPNDSRIITEEPFGPIVPTQPWTDEEDVIARANNTNAGLGASVFSKDIAHAEKVAQRLEAGNVFINSFTKPVPQAFFSGHKESGIGGEWGSQGEQFPKKERIALMTDRPFDSRHPLVLQCSCRPHLQVKCATTEPREVRARCKTLRTRDRVAPGCNTSNNENVLKWKSAVNEPTYHATDHSLLKCIT